MIILQVISWLSLFLIFYTYLIFPLIIKVLARNKKPESIPLEMNKLPKVSVLMAAFNEEKVLDKKLASLFDTSYPREKLEILVGSDASTDRSNEILEKWEQSHGIRPYLLKERKGKPGIINMLAEKAEGDILLITDADVQLSTTTLEELVNGFRDEEVGLCDTRMINRSPGTEGIIRQEKYYAVREVQIKYNESLVWKTMMGPFGGCYAVRKKLYRQVPDNFLVDDFFINMSVLEQGYACISRPGAVVFEEVTGSTADEFRRKLRISAGNFQNLNRFKKLLFRGPRGTGFCFFSHKILRWLTPLLVILSLGTSAWLGFNSTLYMVLALLQLSVILSTVIDHFLRIFKIQILPLRFISHFVLMNLALLAGFFKYLGGIRNNVWQPTSRKNYEA